MIKNRYENDYSALIDMFYGISVSTIVSLDKQPLSSISESYFLLDLPINGKNIYDCLEQYISPELMENENAWLNEKTQQKENVYKQITFWNFPKIVIFTLKEDTMNISLRKANALQNSINDAIKSLESNPVVGLNEFQDAEVEIARVRVQTLSQLDTRKYLYNALYEIRQAVSAANHTAGIDAKLAQVAHLDKLIQLYNSLVSQKVRESAAVIAGKLEKMRTRTETSRLYGFESTVDTSVFAQEDLDDFRKEVAQLKKAKQKTQDEILELNVRTEIAVSASTQAVLTSQGLV
jgi:uncharacterized protein YdcH (DUF465 family)